MPTPLSKYIIVRDYNPNKGYFNVSDGSIGWGWECQVVPSVFSIPGLDSILSVLPDFSVIQLIALHNDGRSRFFVTLKIRAVDAHMHEDASLILDKWLNKAELNASVMNLDSYVSVVRSVTGATHTYSEDVGIGEIVFDPEETATCEFKYTKIGQRMFCGAGYSDLHTLETTAPGMATSCLISVSLVCREIPYQVYERCGGEDGEIVVMDYEKSAPLLYCTRSSAGGAVSMAMRSDHRKLVEIVPCVLSWASGLKEFQALGCEEIKSGDNNSLSLKNGMHSLLFCKALPFGEILGENYLNLSSLNMSLVAPVEVFGRQYNIDSPTLQKSDSITP